MEILHLVLDWQIPMLDQFILYVELFNQNVFAFGVDMVIFEEIELIVN